ncbi:pyridoxine 5'-phosphate synthase [Candidatus Williamhamiltonella defendens]|uniref:pyridoxine 5'-phosphate synthase n=1 Tax=Candidatus Williamhamiltonella defendens TaxID=138072 RepID=UPI00130DB192|nr:pyridoxine 5'-phosphate synthase [Candidatus Hamiltonella defensa]
MKDILLGVNIDHVATLRNARMALYPDPVQAAFIAEQAGADSITVHLREDRRHITERDLHLLSQTIQTRLNLEMAVTNEMREMASAIKPYSCCLVPEKREEITTEGGLDMTVKTDNIFEMIAVLSKIGIVISVFIDPDKQQIDLAVQAKAQYIELHTGTYANTSGNQKNSELQRIVDAAAYASQKKLKVNAGHGLNYHNVKAIAAILDIEELNIGHAIISRTLISGLASAVSEMKKLIKEARQ